jgi:membrane protease YdiL (CAAX protease family)
MNETTFRETDLDDRLLESRSRRLLFFVLAFAIFAADFLVIELADHLRGWVNLSSDYRWNWFGKFTSITFSCLVLACSPWLRQNVGLHWRQSPGSARLSVSCFVAYLACAIGLSFMMPPMAFSAQTLMFQFFMPGIDEEVLIRGIMLALLERAFGQSPMSCRLRFGYAALITSLVFGFPHGISIVDGKYQFSFLLFSIPTAWAAIAALVRTRSGSLLWPIIYHGVWNGSIFLVAMMR